MFADVETPCCELSILLVEDDSNDVLLMKRALEKNGLHSPLHVVGDGEEALHYLQHTGPFVDLLSHPFPDVILMDLKLPRINGLEVLHWLHEHPECPAVPTIVFSASRIDSDVKEAYRLGANTYFVKPANFDELLELVRLMHEYWRRAERPTVAANC